jgi:F-type H+-transporting ATPase subunit epsilon
MKKINLKIVTPEKIIYDDEVRSVSLPTVEGEITVLPGHIPLISAIKSGELKIRRDEKKEEFFAITRGVAEVDSGSIVILTDAAEKAEEIDVKRAEEARQKASELMSKTRVGEETYADAVAQMERALSRIRIGKKRRHGSSTSINHEQSS